MCLGVRATQNQYDRVEGLAETRVGRAQLKQAEKKARERLAHN